MLFPKVVFINGPKEAGKSTLTKLLVRQHPNALAESFAEPIRQALLATFWPDEQICGGLDLTQPDVKRREMPFPRRNVGRTSLPVDDNTIRDAMISFSEDWMKARWGNDVFGKLALARCQAMGDFYASFIFSDSGFAPEALPLVDWAGPSNCLLVQLDRPGCSFAGDSRSYIELPGVRTLSLLNDGTPEDLLAAFQAIYLL